jgi:hypothetical protein
MRVALKSPVGIQELRYYVSLLPWLDTDTFPARRDRLHHRVWLKSCLDRQVRDRFPEAMDYVTIIVDNHLCL